MGSTNRAGARPRAQWRRAFAPALAGLAMLATGPAFAQVPNETELAALRFLNTTQSQRDSVKSACVGGGVAAGGGAVGAGAAIVGGASGPGAVLVIVGGLFAVGGGGYACSSAFDNARYPLTDAWYQLTTVEARKQALRHLAADGLINVFINNLPHLLRDPLPLSEGGPTMKDFAEDLQRGFLLCMGEPNPNTAETCARIIGDATPAASTLRQNLARNHMVARCVQRDIQTARRDDRTFLDVIAGCQIVADVAFRDNTLTPITVNHRDVPPLPSTFASGTPIVVAGTQTRVASGPLNALNLVSYSGSALTFAQIGATKTDLVPLGPGINRVTFEGKPVTIGLSNDPWTQAITGGFIEIDGLRYEFTIQRDAKGVSKYDPDGNLLYTITTPGGQRYEGAGGGGKPFKLKPLRYSEYDVPVLSRLQFVKVEGSDVLRLVGGGAAVDLEPGTTTFALNGLVGRVERDAAGKPTTFAIYTPNGIERYGVGTDGKLVTTPGPNGSQILRGTLVTPGGQVLAITQELQADGKSVRTERDSAGRVMRTVKADPASGYSEEFRDNVTTVRDRDGRVVRTWQRDPESGAVLVCGAYGPDGNPNSCTDGERTWNPNDGWSGANPFSAVSSSICLGPRASCPIGLDEWIANPLMGVWGDGCMTCGIEQPPLTFDICWKDYVAGKSLAQVRATVGGPRTPMSGGTRAWDCAGFVSGVDGLPDTFDGARRGRILSSWGILLVDGNDATSVPTTPDPNDPTRQLPIACVTTLANRELLVGIERMLPNSVTIEPVGNACITSIDPYRVDFTLPAWLPDRTYRLTLRDATSGRVVTNNLGVALRGDPVLKAVDALSYAETLPVGGYGSVFGPTGATETVATDSLDRCDRRLGGREVWLSTYGSEWAGSERHPACVTYVSPGQVNFRLPADLMPGSYVAYVLDAARIDMQATDPRPQAIEDAPRSLPVLVKIP